LVARSFSPTYVLSHFGLSYWWGPELLMSFIKKQKRNNILDHSWILGSWSNRLCAKPTSNPLAL